MGEQSGSVLAGYRIERAIGQGAFGCVFEATREAPRGPVKPGTRVALKVFHDFHVTGPQGAKFVERFHREARLAEQLAHPHVVRMLEDGEDGGRHYVVMELVAGESLGDHLARVTAGKPGTGLPPDEVIAILRQVAGVLQTAHEIGLVHRDIKPDNIFVSKDTAGRVQTKLLDFGLAKDLLAHSASLTSLGSSVGTPAYMSPEQHMGTAEPDIRSDLYSLGVTAWALLAGRPPFKGPTISAFARQHVDETAPLVRSVNPAVPENLSRVIGRLLAKKQEDRHQTPAELLEDLNRVERGEAPRGARSSRAMLVTALLVVLAVIAGVVYVRMETSRAARDAAAGAVTTARGLGAAGDYPNAITSLDTWLREHGTDEDAASPVRSTLADLRTEQGRRYREDFEAGKSMIAGARSPGACDEAAARLEQARRTMPSAEVEEALRSVGARKAGLLQSAARTAVNAALAAAEQAEKDRDLVKAVAKYREATTLAAPLGGESRAEAKVTALQTTIDRYDRAMATGRSAATEEFRLEEALVAFDEAKGAWPERYGAGDGPKLREGAAAALAQRKDWVAVFDFTVEANVRMDLTGQAVAVKLEQAFGSQFRFVERRRIQDALAEQKLGQSDLFQREKASKFGAFVGAQLAVVGDVVRVGDEVTIAARLIDLRTGTQRQRAEVSARAVSEFNALFRELATVLPMTDAAKADHLARKVEYPKYLAAAQEAERQGRWAEAEAAFRKAAEFQDTQEARDGTERCRKRGAYESKMAAAKALLDGGRWTEAETAYAAAEPFARDAGVSPADARTGAERARTGLADERRAAKRAEYETKLREAQGLLAAERWVDAESAFTAAARLAEAAGVDATAATAGRKQASDGARYGRLGQLAPGKYDERTLAGMRSLFSSGGWRLAEPAVSSGGLLEAVHMQTGLEFVLIPAGSFDMGSNDGDSDEKPVHRVTLTKAFLLCETECTQAAYRTVTGQSPSKWSGDTLPVEQVSWEDSKAFCDKAGLRLPTEAEWEYACRAGSTGAYGYGDDEGRLGEYAWYGQNAGSQSHPVAQKRANAFGLFDMHGNVWEWCADWYVGYSAGSVTDPTGAGAASFRVLRGGCWLNTARFARSACRGGFGPGYRVDSLGFRPARSVATE